MVVVLVPAVDYMAAVVEVAAAEAVMVAAVVVSSMNIHTSESEAF